jgi:transcriptional regulator with XRE-family HTH domain
MERALGGFAEFTGVPRRVVMEFEQGRGNPTLKTLEKLLKGSGLKIGLQRAPK